MRARYALLADYVNQTNDGKLNILGIFERILAAQVPAIHGAMHLVIAFETDPPDRGQAKQVEVRLLEADGRELLRMATTMQIPADAPLVAQIPQVIGLAGLRFERFGRYAFYVTVNGEQKAEIPFSVELPPAPTPPPAAPPPAM